MAGRAASLERLDDSHPAAAAWAWVDRLICCGFCCGGTVGRLLLLHRLHRCRRRDQIARPRDGLRLAAAGQQPVVPDAVEAVRQDVDQKPADELAWLERHGLVAAGPLDPVVFVAKRNAGRVGGDEASTSSAGCWRWRPGGCSAPDRPAPARARQTVACYRRTTWSDAAAR